MQPKEPFNVDGAAGFHASALLDSLPFPVYVVHHSGRLLHANTDWDHFVRGERGLGTDRKAPIGAPLTDVLPSGAHRRWQPIIQGLLAGKTYPGPGGAYIEQTTIARLPESAYVRIAASAIRQAEGPPAGVLLTSASLALSPAAGETAWQREIQEAAGLDVARQLAATLNHEINNPLFIVSATLEDLLADTSDPNIQRRLNAALDAVWRVASAVKQLQDIRQLVSTPYIEGFPMIDLEASQERPKPESNGE